MVVGEAYVSSEYLGAPTASKCARGGLGTAKNTRISISEFSTRL